MIFTTIFFYVPIFFIAVLMLLSWLVILAMPLSFVSIGTGGLLCGALIEARQRAKLGLDFIRGLVHTLRASVTDVEKICVCARFDNGKHAIAIRCLSQSNTFSYVVHGKSSSEVTKELEHLVLKSLERDKQTHSKLGSQISNRRCANFDHCPNQSMAKDPFKEIYRLNR